MSKKHPHELEDFMRQASSDMVAEYRRIYRRAKEDPGTAGDEGEGNWAELLTNWLPITYRVQTKGRILFEDGRASPQVDVIVLKPSYPSALETKKVYLAGGVAAAFECKTTLTKRHIADAVKTCAAIQRLAHEASRYSLVPITPYRQLFGRIPFGLLAHSHSWSEASAFNNVTTHLWDADDECVSHPREAMDLLTVADLGTWSINKSSYSGPKLPDWTPEIYARTDPEGLYPEGYAWTAWVAAASESSEEFDYRTMGGLLKSLTERLAWEDSSLRSLAEYYHVVRIAGVSSGPIRPWPLTVFDERIRSELVSNVMPCDRWSEWRYTFP